MKGRVRSFGEEEKAVERTKAGLSESESRERDELRAGGGKGVQSDRLATL